MEKLGWASAPHAGNVETGAQVFVFFEGGDINFPVYFAFAQSGEGWLSEHPNQHVFKSDNVRIKIDENVKDRRSTCKFDSYNSKNSKISKLNLERDCTKHGWKFDQEKGVIKDLETRIDIEVLAENLNAINLNIHGNVNMKLDGNWFVEHYGNKYEYHEGDTYIKQKGSTYIEREGVVRIKHEGDKSVEHIGHYYLTHNGDTMETHTGSYFMMVDGDVTFTFNSEYKLTVGKNYSETVKLSKNADIFGSKNLNIYDSYNEIIANNKFISAEGFYDLLVGESITSKSYRGNILLETEGDFELTKDGKITPVGFTNIGTKGNIQIISTFGNINLQCKKDDSKAQFNKKCISIPWNPSFVTQLEKMASAYPEFNKIDSILGAEALNTDLDEFDITKFIQLFKEFTSSLLIYDGLPVFLPTRMIVQNPNIPIPKNVNDVSWIPNFRSEASNWKNISESAYWKLPGRLMGNINIETWSGDINIKTNSELGCAGNINIEATESAGTLPGYKIGTINIKNEGKKRIYPDPRDLFLDSDFMSRLGGQINLFTHGTNLTDSFRRTVLPPAAAATLLATLGCSVNWVATNYDDFYKLYGTAVLTKGSLTGLTPLALQKLDEISKKDGPKLGCTKCISDYLLGIPGIQDLCYATESLSNFGTKGLHTYGFNKFNPFDKDNPRGTFNIETLDFDKISIGDGHAIEMGFIDKEFVGPNIGAFNITSSGDFNQNVGRNYSFKANTTKPNGLKTISYTYTEEWYDTIWPFALKTSFEIINSIWNNSIGLLATIKNGDFTILKGLKIETGLRFLDFPFPENKFLVLGYTTCEKETLNSKINMEKLIGFSSTIDFGFNFEKAYEIIKNPTILEKGTLKFTEHEFASVKINDTAVNERNQITDKNFSLKLSSPYNLNIRKIDSYKNYFSYENNFDIRSGSDEFNLDWDILSNDVLKLFFPDYYYKSVDDLSIKQGRGYNLTQHFISYKHHSFDGKDVVNSISDPDEAYVDFTENLNKSVMDGGYADGKPRNIKITNTYNAGRCIMEETNWTSAINSKILSLNSNGLLFHYKNDEDKKIMQGLNSIVTNLNGMKINYDDEDSIVNIKNEMVFNLTKFNENIFYVNNGSETHGRSINEIIFNNGEDSAKSKNIFEVNNGNISSEGLGRGEYELNEIILSSPNNGDIPVTYILHTNRYNDDGDICIESYIREHATIEKYLSTRFITVKAEENSIHTNNYVLNSSSIIELNSPKIEENFKTLNKPEITAPNFKDNSDRSILKSYKYYLEYEFKVLKEIIQNIFK